MATHLDNPESPAEIDQRVLAEKLKLLFHQSFPALLISLVVALLYAWVSWDFVDHALLQGWLGILGLTTTGRLGLFIAYFRAEPQETDPLRWKTPYILSLMLSALVWGFGALGLMSPDSPLHQSFTMVILVGMAGGAVANYAALRPMAIGAMLAVLLPSTTWLYLSGGKLQMAMALGVIIFILGAMRSTRVLAQALYRSLRLTEELRLAHESAAQLAQTDVLTGVNNRRAFYDFGEQVASYCRRTGRPLCVLLIDIDHFKSINDHHGHSAGDNALRQVGTLLRDSLRKSDLCGRLGGEEFAILLPDTSLAEGRKVAEKLRETIAATPIALRNGSITITASIGVAENGHDIETLLHHADASMYQAKAEGRNRVICHAAPPLAQLQPA